MNLIDRGWLPLPPLRTHVVICGFPRSGSTLLQLVLGTSFDNTMVFQREVSAVGAAHMLRRSAPVMITKRPNDLFLMDEIRDIYKESDTAVRFVVTVRDPRAVMTSVRNTATAERDFYVSPERWRVTDEFVEQERAAPDVLTVEFSDLVETPTQVQEQLADFIGCKPTRSFNDFHAAVPENFTTVALNGVRPLDVSAIDRWREPQYADRIRFLLGQVPDLPQRLIELGYESDTRWTQDYVG